MEELIKKLNSLKGILLLTTQGTLYVLVGFKVAEDVVKKKGFFTRNFETVRYVSEIELDKARKMHFSYEESSRVATLVGDLVNDRNRYLRMLRDLNDHNYTIRKKQ